MHYYIKLLYNKITIDIFDDGIIFFQKVYIEKNGIEVENIFNNYSKLYKTQEELNNEFFFRLFPS